MFCESCGLPFVEKTPTQKYCSHACRYRDNNKKRYKKRKSQGLCPQCGYNMKEKTSASYCKDCQKYFKKRYIEQNKQI